MLDIPNQTVSHNQGRVRKWIGGLLGKQRGNKFTFSQLIGEFCVIFILRSNHETDLLLSDLN